MTNRELYRARVTLGLSRVQMAAMLDTDPTTVKKWETAETNVSYRPPPARVIRLMQAYLDGWRPDDWPEIQEDPT